MNTRFRYRYNNDVDFKLAKKIQNDIKKKYLGCAVNQLHEYFEQNYFQEEGNEWMSWDNHGGGRCHINRSWEIDHIMPVSSFDLSDEEEVKKCFHWSNLQPLSWQDNMEKRDSIPKYFEWCYVKERWMWSKASGRMNYELPSVEKDEEDDIAET